MFDRWKPSAASLLASSRNSGVAPGPSHTTFGGGREDREERGQRGGGQRGEGTERRENGKGEMGKGKGWERTSVEEEAKKEEEAEEGVGTARREVRWVIWRKEEEEEGFVRQPWSCSKCPRTPTATTVCHPHTWRKLLL